MGHAGDEGGPWARFEPLGELGRGGMGVVHRARDRTSGREVALKLVAPGALDPEGLARFRREAEAGAALRHPGIVAVHAAGLAGPAPWIAFELVPGARPLDRAWVGLDRAARAALVRDAARALGHAHARGVVHRDVKPANLLVGDDGRVRVADLGLARVAGGERLTTTGEVVGTPFAMSPEQARGERDRVGPPADVWGLGVVLYEALTGARPFPGRSAVEVLTRVVEGRVTPPRAIDPSVPAALEAVVLRALAPDPADRFADGAALAAALDAALGGPVAPPRAGLAAALTASAGTLLALTGLAVALRSPPAQRRHGPVAAVPSAAPPADRGPPTDRGPPGDRPPRGPAAPPEAPPAAADVPPEAAPVAPQGVAWACRWLARRFEAGSDGRARAQALLARPDPDAPLAFEDRGMMLNVLHHRAKDHERRGDVEGARGCRRVCAELGCANCTTWVGEALREAGDLAGAARWLRRGVAAGDEKARTRLGVVLLRSDDPAAQAEGRALVLEAAEASGASSLALANAGFALTEARGGPPEPARAAELLRRAASAAQEPSRDAALRLLRLLDAGEAPPADPGEPARLRERLAAWR